MRKVEFEQGSEEWLQWRKGLLTATDAPMLMGVSPYVTPYKGWQRKVGQAQEQTVNSAMRRGQKDEPIARSLFIEQFNINMNPCCIESETYNFLGASLDGISDCGNYILEIKSQNMDAIKANGIPKHHMYQMQHQLLCTDNSAKMCFYVTIWNNDIHVLEVFPDEEWRKTYLVEARAFWKRVVFFEPPDMSKKDYKDMSSENEWASYSCEYKKISDQIKQLEKVKDSYREELVKMCGEDSCYGNGIKVLKKMTKGRIDYEIVPELEGVELDKYRKPSTFSWTIMIDQK